MQSGYSNFLSFQPTSSRFNLLLLEEGEYLFEEYAATLLARGPSLPPELSGAGGAISGRLRVCSRSLSFEPDDQRLHIFKFPLRAMPRRPQVLAALAPGALATELCAAVAGAGLSTRDAMACQATQVVLMKAFGAVAPYLVRQCGAAEPSGAGSEAPGKASGKRSGGLFGGSGSSGGSGGGGASSAPPPPPSATSSAFSTSAATLLFVLAHTPAVEVVPDVQELWDIQVGCIDAASGRERGKLEPIVARKRDGPFNLSLLSDYRERTLTPNSPAPTAERVFPLVTCPGRIAVTASALYFEPVAVNNPSGSDPVQKWPLRDIARVRRRPRLQRAVGLELELVEGARGSGTLGGTDLSAAGLSAEHSAAQAVFFAFDSPASRDEVYNKLVEALWGWARSRDGSSGSSSSGSDAEALAARHAALGDPPASSILEATAAWQARALSTLDYLLLLNSAAGRSRSDLTACPVLPWVLADYTSPTLDLTNPAVFRDLSKPIGALNASRLASYRARYADMPREADCDPPFLYGTHYSTPGYCLYYLARAMPEHMLRLQSGRFDAPDRMFHDVAATYAGVTGTNSDLKELIPEFYMGDGSFLLMPDGLNLGVRSTGKRMGDVGLPPWAQGYASDFVAQMREALECEHVSSALHAWIDLVFGAKQRGAAAEAADNVFYHLTYEGAVDVEGIVDPDKRASTQAQIAEFGQTPRQLFARAHPRRGDPPAPQHSLHPAGAGSSSGGGGEGAVGGGGGAAAASPVAVAVAVVAAGVAVGKGSGAVAPSELKTGSTSSTSSTSSSSSAGAAAAAAAAAAAPAQLLESVDSGGVEAEGARREATGVEGAALAAVPVEEMKGEEEAETQSPDGVVVAAQADSSGSPSTLGTLDLALLTWTPVPLAPPATPLHTAQVNGLAAVQGGLLVTCGADGLVNVLSHSDLAAAAGEQPAAFTTISRHRPHTAPASSTATATTTTALLYAALYGDEVPLPIKACALLDDAPIATAPRVAFVADIGGMAFALPLTAQGGASSALAPPCIPLASPAPSALQCLTIVSCPLGKGLSLTLLVGGASDGSVYAWQWCRDSATFSRELVATVVAPLAAGAGAGAGAGAPATAPAITACAATLLPSASASAATALLALGDATGAVGVVTLLVRRLAAGAQGAGASSALPLDASLGEPGAAAAAGALQAPPCLAAVEFRHAASSACSAVACDPLARGDLFTGSCSGVTGAVWAPGLGGASGSSAAGGGVQRLVTSGSDGRITLWSADTAAAAAAASGAAGASSGGALRDPLHPLAVLASGSVVRCLRLSPLWQPGCPPQLLSCGNTAGEVRVWSLAALWERAQGARGSGSSGSSSSGRQPVLLAASDALVCTLPPPLPPQQQQQPLTALAVSVARGGGVQVFAGARGGGLAVWHGRAAAAAAPTEAEQET